MPPVSAMIIGSSFVNRLNTFISESRYNQCRYENLRFKAGFAEVYIEGVGGLNASGLHHVYDYGFSTCPPDNDIIVCHAGGNDLAWRESLNVAVDLYDYATHVCEDFGVKHFVCCNVLNRYSVNGKGTLKFDVSEILFNQRAADLNQKLSLMFDTPSLHYWDLRSLEEPFYISGSDGVHLTHEGMQPYLREMRGAVLKYSNRLRGSPDWVPNSVMWQ